MEKIGENIRFFRRKRGWTQQELANKISVSRSVLTRWENGSVIPDITALVKLSQVFSVSVDILVGHMPNPSEVIQEVRHMYRLNEDEVDQAIVDIIRYLNQHEELKHGLAALSRMSSKQRKSLEHILTVMLQELVK